MLLDLYQQSFPCGLPWWLDGKESACTVGDLKLIPGLGRSPGGGHGNPLQYSCLENHHGQRSLVGYSHGVEKPRPPSGRRTPLHQLQSQGASCQGLRETVAVTEQHDEREKAISPLYPERFLFISLPVSCLRTT